MDKHSDSNVHETHHHILPTKVAVGIGGTLLFLTFVTVYVAGIDLGKLNFFVAMVISTTKALLVCLFFMNLLYDRRENGMIFSTSFLFLAIFIVLTSTDLFFRGDVYVKGPLFKASAAGQTSKLAKPWVSTPELVAHGKEVFQQNCVLCHGQEGKGNGPAAAPLNPHPRNFTANEGWKNGRKPTMVFKTIKEGLPPSAMTSFAFLPVDDRWALVHYVLSLGPTPPGSDTPEDFAKAGVDPTKPGGGAAAVAEAPSIPVDLAMERMAVAEEKTAPQAQLHAVAPGTESGGARLYRTNCASCHGSGGEGGVAVRNLGENPRAYVTTEAFHGASTAIASEAAFSAFVSRGLPGNLMPGFGEFSGAETAELYSYVRSLAK